MSESISFSALPRRTRWLALALFVLMVAEIFRLFFASSEAFESLLTAVVWFARGWFVFVCILGLPVCSVREKSLMGLAAVLTIALVRHPNADEIIGSALGLAAFIGVFIAVLTSMKEAAARSRAIVDVGIYLTTQPAQKRFLSVALGTHVLGAFLNFGAPGLMAPLVQKGAQHSLSEPVKVTEQRQMSALIRGFSWILLWAPTTLTQAVLLGLFVEVDYAFLVGLGLCTAAVMILLGLLMDRHDWGRPVARPERTMPERPSQAIRVVSLICAGLFAATYALKFAAGFTVAESLVITAPSATVLWLLAQQKTKPFKEGMQSTVGILTGAAPSLLRSAIALGLSGYIGRVSIYLLPVEDIAAWIETASFSPFVFYCAVPVIITIGGQIALSPIIFVVFLGGLLSELPGLDVDPTLAVFSLSFGWALSMAASPNATATLVISAVSDIPPTTLTWKWNGRYAILCYGVFVALIFALTR
ncbi:hypothetical protein CSC82_04425 [Rhodobacteraceae bacterium 4F10]|nr:hypothetical protein CSC82_04425 [Rhodobacteraceae bacterium 4F10]